MTPEGRIKNKINKLLAEYGTNIYVFMPVQVGYGKRTVDYLCCIRGVFFAIEAKKPESKGRVTALQSATLEQVQDAGGIGFVVYDDASLAELKRWLDSAMKVVEWRVA